MLTNYSKFVDNWTWRTLKPFNQHVKIQHTTAGEAQTINLYHHTFGRTCRFGDPIQIVAANPPPPDHKPFSLCATLLRQIPTTILRFNKYFKKNCFLVKKHLTLLKKVNESQI